MAFERRYWIDGRAGGTLVNGDNLNRIEEGIADAHDATAAALASATAAISSAGRAETLALAASEAATAPADEVIAQSINDDTTATRAAVVAAISATAPAGLPAPMTGAAIGALPAGSAKPVGAIDGQIYGFGEGYLRTTQDGGATWTIVTALPAGASNVIGIRKNTAGQIVLACTQGVWLSAGWGTGSVSWSTRKVTPNGLAAPQPFSFDGTGDKFIYTEYGPGSTQAWADSRYAHISTDGGETWVRVWDSDVNTPNAPTDSHIHGVAYDPWNDTFYLSEGHSVGAGIYHSTDDGATWSIAPGMKVSNLAGATASPTSLCATDEGLVCGSDSAQAQGMFGVVRTPNPMDQRLEQTWAWRPTRSSNFGWGHQSQRDPATGLVYVMFRSQATGTAPIIAAGTPTSAAKVWEWPDAASFTISDTFLSWAFDKQMRAVLYGTKGGVERQVTGRIPRPRAGMHLDAGGVMGGVSNDGTSLAVGTGSGTGTFIRSVAVGVATQAEASDSVVIGWGSRATVAATTAVGVGATGAGTAVAVGDHANAVGTCVAVGANANASAPQSISVGRNATSAGINGVAVGFGAKADTGSSNVALGASSVTTASNQIATGPRYLEMGEVATAITNAPADKGRLGFRDSGGKTQLVVAFPTGAVREVAREGGGVATPAMSTASRNAIVGAAVGEMVFDSTLGQPAWFNGTTWVDAMKNQV